MQRTVWFDMDGTIADLYGINMWLDYLQKEEVYPYEAAKTMVNMSQLARLLHKIQAAGLRVGIISWLSKSGSELYNGQVALTKLVWLKQHLPSVQWDEIRIVKYGTPKQLFAHTEQDILFDDEERNRQSWNGKAYSPNDIVQVLKALCKT